MLAPGVETQLQGERAQLVIPPGAGQSLPAQQVAQRWSEPSPTPRSQPSPHPAIPHSPLGLHLPVGKGRNLGEDTGWVFLPL